jgi:anti-sigma factor RsiW
MDCREVSQKLNAYLDGALLSQAGEEVRDHLAACASCAAELEQLKRLNHALDALQGMVPPAYFSCRLRELASSRAGAGFERGAAVRPYRRAAFSRVLARVAAGLLIVAGLWMGLTMGGTLGSTDAASVGVEEVQTDELDMQVYALSVSPAESVAGAYISLVSETE